MNYCVNHDNPFMRKAKNCCKANTYNLSCMECQTYEQANAPEHAECFEPKIMPWTHDWIKFDDVQRMIPTP